MSGLGNPLSFALGGGPSPQEMVYDAIFQAVGDGLRGPYGSIVEAWRLSKSCGIAATIQDDRAAMQAFPNMCTDYLPVYENLLQIVPETGQSEEDRRQLVTERYTRTIDATFPKLEAQLDVVDPLFEIIIPPFELTRTTEMSVRAFQDWNPGSGSACGPAFGAGRKQTLFPNYSDSFVLYAYLNVGSGPTTATNLRTMAAVKAGLNESLPAWVDFRVFSSIGFILDLDALDVTAFGDGVLP
jgi:hypothetical protein